MSVLFETSLGDLVIDLEIEACPELCSNFLKVRRFCPSTELAAQRPPFGVCVPFW